jgi:hypothetical protein
MAVSPNRGSQSDDVAARVRLSACTGFALVSVLVAACGGGSSSPASPTVRVVPVPAGAGGAWSWSASCPFTPREGAACRSSNPDVGRAQLTADAWNLGAAPKSPTDVRMSIGSTGSLTVRGDLPDAPPCTASSCTAPSANTWVRGYPSVLYGINQCNADTSPASSPNLPLPMRVDAIPSDLIATSAYSADPAGATYDIAYDLWLNDSPTRAPCRTTGTIEVMVWTGYDSQALLPEALRIGTASSPFGVDGTGHTGTDAWSVYANNVYSAGRTAPWGGTFWFVLDRADAANHGTISVDLSSVLADVGGLLRRDYGWSDFQSSYWLDTIPFGMEFGPANGALTGPGSSNFSLTVSSLCLDTGTTVSSAPC